MLVVPINLLRNSKPLEDEIVKWRERDMEGEKESDKIMEEAIRKTKAREF